MIITGYGIVCSFDAPRRLVVYILQAGACLAIMLFGFFHFHKKKTQYFKGVVYAYALLEAVLFLLFALHFATDGRILFKVLPIVGILISASICLFDEAKIRQKAYFEENEGK